MLGELEEKVQIKHCLSKSVHQLSSNIATALLVLTLFSIENPSTQLSNLSLLTQFAAVGKQEAYCAEQKKEAKCSAEIYVCSKASLLSSLCPTTHRKDHNTPHTKRCTHSDKVSGWATVKVESLECIFILVHS